jgi:hypothetical protein
MKFNATRTLGQTPAGGKIGKTPAGSNLALSVSTSAVSFSPCATEPTKQSAPWAQGVVWAKLGEVDAATAIAAASSTA